MGAQKNRLIEMALLSAHNICFVWWIRNIIFHYTLLSGHWVIYCAIDWQWLSGRVLESKSRGCWLEPHWRHCLVSLSKTLYPLLSTGSTQEDPSWVDWKNVDLDVKNQNKQNHGFPGWTENRIVTDQLAFEEQVVFFGVLRGRNSQCI